MSILTPEFSSRADEFFRTRIQHVRWHRPIALVDGAFEPEGSGLVLLKALIAARRGDREHPHLCVVSGPADGSTEPQVDYPIARPRILYIPASGILLVNSVRITMGPSIEQEGLLQLSLADPAVPSKFGEQLLRTEVIRPSI